MANTTPDNLRTPDPGTPYNLVPDLSTLASDTQAALVKRANLYKGLSSQRQSFTSAENGVSWKDTDGSQMMWNRVSGTWRPADQFWKGTTSERNAITSLVTEGFHWYNTTTDLLEYYNGSAWVGRSRTVGGVFSGVTNINGQVTVNHGLGVVPITASANMLTSTPVIPNSLNVMVGARTATTIVFRVTRLDSGGAGFLENPVEFIWSATG